MAEKKVRIRKAPATDGQTDILRTADTGSEAPKSSRLHFARPILRPLRWLTPSYFINSWREVRQVTWPSRRETWRLTLAVFIFAIIFGAMIAGVDKVLDLVFKKLILQQ